MDKNKGIWIVIACILIVGITVTVSTNWFVEKGELSAGTGMEYIAGLQAKETTDSADISAGTEEENKLRNKAAQEEYTGGYPLETSQAAAESRSSAVLSPQTADSYAEDKDAGSGLVESGGDTQVFTETLESSSQLRPVEEIEAEVISPLETPGTAKSAADPDPSDARTYYQERLADLDAQIQKMRNEETDTTTYSMKAAADNELKIWDKELNTVYTAILDHMDEEQKKTLLEEERKWMKERDAKAVESSRKYSGGTMEGLEYTASLVTSTRERVYELVNRYIDLLDN